MTKSELTKKLLKKYSYMSTADAKVVIDCIFNTIADAVIQGHKVELRGFGIFGLKHRTAGLAKNPKTGEIVNIGERYSVFFRMGKKIQDFINVEDL